LNLRPSWSEPGAERRSTGRGLAESTTRPAGRGSGRSHLTTGWRRLRRGRRLVGWASDAAADTPRLETNSEARTSGRGVRHMCGSPRLTAGVSFVPVARTRIPRLAEYCHRRGRIFQGGMPQPRGAHQLDRRSVLPLIVVHDSESMWPGGRESGPKPGIRSARRARRCRDHQVGPWFPRDQFVVTD